MPDETDEERQKRLEKEAADKKAANETPEQTQERLEAESDAKKADEKEAARKKAAKEKAEKEKGKPAPPNKVNFEYYLRTMDKANHERFCIASGHRAQLKKEGRDKILRLIKDWDSEINVIIKGQYVAKKESKKKGEK